MGTYFTQTDVINSKVVEAGSPRVYTVFVDGAFRGWVSGGSRDFRFLAEGGFSWGPSATTRAKAIEAHDARVEAERQAAAHRSEQVPTDVKVVRLTADNIAEEGPGLIGWYLDGAEDLGPVRNARKTFDGHENAKIIGSKGSDVLGLPSTVTAYRV